VWGALDPVGPASASTSTYAQYWVFEQLARFDERGQLVPRLASRVERRGARRYYVELRGDHSFSDGTTVTSADVERSLRANGIRMMAAGAGFLLEPVEATAPLEILLARSLIFRQKAGRLMGSGPLAVVEEMRDRIHLARRSTTPGRISDVFLIAYATPRDAFTHTLRGDANLIPEPDPRWLEFFAGVPRLRLIVGAGRQTDSIAFNLEQSKEDRVALAKAITSSSVPEMAFGGGCAEARNRATTDTPIRPGPKLDLLSWPSMERFALAVRRRLGERGGEVLQLPLDEVLTRVRRKQFELVTARAQQWPPAMAAFLWRTGAPGNLFGYSNPAVDATLDAEDWAAAAAALEKDPPEAFVCTRDRTAVVDARIKNATLGPYDLLETLPDWEVGQ